MQDASPEHASSQHMRRTVNPTGLDDLQWEKPNIADARDDVRRAQTAHTTRIRRVNQAIPNGLLIRRRPIDICIAATEHTTESVDGGSRSATRAGHWNDMERALSIPSTRIRRVNQPVPSDLPVRRRSTEMSITEIESARQGTSHTNECVEDGSGSVTKAGTWNGMERPISDGAQKSTR